MKSFVLVLSVIVAVNADCHDVPESMKQLVDECMKEAGIPDVQSMVNPGTDESMVKAAVTCMMKKSGMLVNGKLDMAKSLDNYVMAMHPEANDSNWRSKITECIMSANNESEEQDVALSMHKCVMEKICPV